MKKNLQWKALLILAVTGLSIWAFTPPNQKIKLGLDLKGGIHLVMKVHTEDAIAAVTDEVAGMLGQQLDDRSLSFETAERAAPGRISVTGVDINKDSDFRSLVETNFPAWDVRSLGSGSWELALKPAELSALRSETVTQAIDTIRRRVDELGVAEPVIAPHGDTGDQILVQLPGFDDVARAKELIRSTAKLELRLVRSAGLSEDQLLAGRPQPSGTEVLPGEPDPGGDRIYYLVDRTPVVTGRDLKNARRSLDYETNTPNVSFTLKPEAASRFQQVTRENIGRQLGIVLDGQVVSAPVIQSAIYDQGQITGNFTLEEAQDLSIKLRSGALPASLEYQEERTVGPSLGADAIRAGILASLVGLGAVVVFVFVYYKLSGLNAVVTLVLNLLILLGLLAYFNATLTLPGIAGVILTIGMGVDSNVLIFERVKEEMRAGKTVRTAISASFSKVFWTVFDSHLTSLIAAAILFQFGTGPVQGFAVTLSIGLIANMFTSIFVSRFIFDVIYGGRRQVEAISI
ncbi:MAG TPA: protein translocase subunit SecD [Vicinamibacteria bacterium]|nr:protein translocase subunit SecD [Vicinamibacteria bacterium]